MKNSILLCFALLFLLLHQGRAQFDPTAYFKYLEAHKGMTAEGLLSEYPAGVFAEYAKTDLSSAQFYDAINAKYNFTSREKELASDHGFMVTERLSCPSYQAAFYDIYTKDLPLYISSDAILHALHRSYDNMLKTLEVDVLSSDIGSALGLMHTRLGSSVFSTDSLVVKAAHDADMYLSVARTLLNPNFAFLVTPVFPENQQSIKEILDLISSETMASYPLFAETGRDMDFSQFKPRGHYTETEKLKNYFRCMMWLGRTEIYITKPVSTGIQPSDEDIRRQCILAVILLQLAKTSGADLKVQHTDDIISKFVGEQDNLSLERLDNVIMTLSITSATELLNDVQWKNFQNEGVKQGGDQKILSQLLCGNPFATNTIKPAAAFMLLGQRFILDSYIFANVVYDKVLNRMMPDPLDVMFVLGNDATLQLLKPELDKYDYAVNLAGLRYLTNSLDSTFWSASLYSTWLSGIRSLNPPLKRDHLPKFMQTGAWWEKTMNTQLTSWAELRHDNLLYAKQSYSGIPTCFYPSGFVEPQPELYRTIARFSNDMKVYLQTYISHSQIKNLVTCLNDIDSTCTLLATMSEKELRSEEFNETEKALIKNWIMQQTIQHGCYSNRVYTGAYPRMMYDVDQDIKKDEDPNFVIADVHTQPADRDGNIVGNVLHVATGKINMALVVANDPGDGCSTAYVGPVGSFYQHVTTDFLRLTDEEWKELDTTQNIPRPSWVNTYLANGNGESGGEALKLITSDVVAIEPVSPGEAVVFPNPVSDRAKIAYVVPPSLSGQRVVVSVYDTRGARVTELMNRKLDAGSYLLQWNLCDASNVPVSNTVFLVELKIGNTVVTKSVSVLR